MLKLLTRIRLEALLAGFATNMKKGGKTAGRGRKALIALLFLYVAACFIFMFFSFFISIAEPFYEMGVGWLYFAFFALVCFALMFVFSVFTAKTQLYEARDNELLLSMPIKPGNILLSRMFMLYFLTFSTGILVAIPAAAAWCIRCPVDPLGAVSFVLVCLLLPLFSLAVSALFGWLLSLATAKVRKKNFITVILSLAFLGCYFYFISRSEELIARLAMEGGALAGKFAAVRPLWWIGTAIAEGSPADMAAGCVFLLAPFVLVYIVLSKTFIRTATGSRGQAKLRYKESSVKSASPRAALYRRELSRFTSSSVYMLNGGLGLVLTLAVAVILVVKFDMIANVLAMLPEASCVAVPIVLLGLCMLCSTVTITSASVSLEGRSLWVIKSLPVDTRDILTAKLLLQISLDAPVALIAEAAVIYAFRPTGLYLAAAIVLPLVFAVLSACLGLWANLRHCNLDWINESQAVKSGVAVLITMLMGFALTALPAVCFALLIKTAAAAQLALGLFTLAAAALTLLFHKLIMTKGVKLFDSL